MSGELGSEAVDSCAVCDDFPFLFLSLLTLGFCLMLSAIGFLPQTSLF